MTHFYLTLPANSSKKFYPDNTMTKFKTHLHSAISLTGEWEVGLSEIVFPRNWYTIAFDEGYFYIEHSDSTNLAEQEEFEIKIPGGYYVSVREIIYKLNEKVRDVLEASFMPGADQHHKFASNFVSFEWNDRTNRVKINIPPKRKLTFSKTLCTILGIDEVDHPLVNDQETEILTLRSAHTADLEAGIHALYIYCDILEQVSVGDILAPLLRIVDVRGKYSEMLYRHFDQPTYVPLQKKHFQAVEIDIKDSYGENIPFESGQLIVTLHFRRSKNPYFL